jgi:phosphoribosylaminoimidazole carboxylase PurE protein
MSATKSSRVAIILGSDSDWPVMQECAGLLKQFDVACDVRILSAHRTPDETTQFAKQAHNDGFGVIIAAAGMAAHLAGILAAHTTLPVIGVPMASGALQGVDALLSTVQMPPGVPVATVGIGASGAKNAALLAVQILALNNPALAAQLTRYKTDMQAAVQKKNEQFQRDIP